MIIAIAVNENHVKAFVDPHFGRCKWYCLLETETQNLSFIENPLIHPDQAGSEAARFLADKKVEMVIAGRFGCKVIEAFRSQNIQMIIPEMQQSLKEILNKLI